MRPGGVLNYSSLEKRRRTRENLQIKFKKEAISSADDFYLRHVTEKYLYRLRETLCPHKSMWSGYIGQINVTQHRIELKHDNWTIREHPYRSVLLSREIESAEIDRMIELNVIPLSKSK